MIRILLLFFVISIISCQEIDNKKSKVPLLESDAKRVADIGCQIETLKDKIYDTEGEERKEAENQLKAVTEEGYSLFTNMLAKYADRKSEFQEAYKRANIDCKYPLSDLQKETVLISPVGEQPAICASFENIKVVYGNGNKIFYSQSDNNGQSFSTPQLVATLDELMLGRGMGPQIATTRDHTSIAAVNGDGNILLWQKKNKLSEWNKSIKVNKINKVAKEGLIALAGDTISNSIYIVWIDTREEYQAKIYGALSKDAGHTWTEKLIYESPDGSICSCCKPNVLIHEHNISITFRNNVNGSRDLHFIKSSDNGATFGQTQKLGIDSWEISGCPMDGGGIAIGPDNKAFTVWKRKNEIFFCEPNSVEQTIGNGWLPSVSFIGTNPIVVWQNNGMILLKKRNAKEIILGQGGSAETASISDKEAFVVWESSNGIVGQKVN